MIVQPALGYLASALILRVGHLDTSTLLSQLCFALSKAISMFLWTA